MANNTPPLSLNLQNDDNTDYAGTDELWANEKFLKKYNSDIVSKLSKYSKAEFEVLEFGAGIGTLAQLWHSITMVKPECLEIDNNLRKVLIDRKFNCYENIDSIHKTFDVIYTSNVLEHIEDDVDILKKLHSKLKSDGVIAIYVPAFMSIYSELDSAVGHYRRYEKAELINKLHLANFKIIDCYFVDSIGFFAWLSVKFLGYKSDKNPGNGKSLEIYDKYIYPLSKWLDTLGLRFLFGKNLLVIANRVS